jgi:hypothetical protein
MAWRGLPPSKTADGRIPAIEEAEADLDTIWLYIARESGSIDVANRV